MDSVNELLFDSLKEFVHRIVNFIPNVMVMFFIVLLGVVLSAIARLVMVWVLGFIKFDAMTERTGISRVLARGGIKISPSRIIVSVLYWVVLLVFFMMGFVALDIVPINNLISEFFSYLPSVAAAAVILLIGFLIGTFTERTVLVAAENAGLIHSELIGKGVKLFIVVMTASMAMEQLGIARGIIIAAFSISFGGIVFAISLAFGLGARDMAKEFLEKRMKKAKEKDESEAV